MYTRVRAIVGVAAVLLAGLVGVSATGAPAGASIRWAPAATARIHPGVAVSMAGVSCMAGFVMTDGTRVFLAIPTSCTGVSEGQPTDGCSAAQVPVGIKVTIQGARYKGTLAYSSYSTMARRGATRENRCRHNALSLVRLDARDIRRTNPSVPVVGGPNGTAGTAPAQGARLTAY